MSNQLIGKSTSKGKKPSTKIPIVGKMPTAALRKVGAIKSKINRDTQAKLLRKYLNEGFDWRMFSPIHVAVIEELGNDEVLLDGDHRRHMAIMALGDEALVPVTLVTMKTVKEYHRYFWKMNMSNRSNVSAEEAFIHRFYSDESKALVTYDNLVACNVRIYGSSEPGGILPLASTGPLVKRGGFDSAIKHASVDAVKAAATLMSKVWVNPDKLGTEILWALALLYADYPCFSNNSKVQTDWELWTARTLGSYSMDKTAKDYKVKGGNVHHRGAESIAYAILQDYRSSDLSHLNVKGTCSQKYKQKFTKMTAITERRDR
jgi:hypothetical protein